MNTKNTTQKAASTIFVRLGLATALALLLTVAVGRAADDPTLTDKTKQAVQTTKEAAVDAGRATAENLETLWQRIDENRLKNRTPDEIAAWILMGVLVASVAGSMTSLNSSGLGKAARILLGLGGAFIGGMVVRVAQINFGWGPVLIRYEELLFSLVGAVILVGAGKILRSRMQKKTPPH